MLGRLRYLFEREMWNEFRDVLGDVTRILRQAIVS